jgi:hypothetical protein
MATKSTLQISIFAVLMLSLILTSCKGLTPVGSDLLDTMDPVEEVTKITGGESSTLVVNRGTDHYFSLEFSDIAPNEIMSNSTDNPGYCIDWQTPINSDGGTYLDVPLYSTFNVEKWNRLNYLFNIVDDLKKNDPNLTYREIQVVIWSLRGNPKFDVDTVKTTDLPGRMQSNGAPNFSIQKVKDILGILEAGYKDFDFAPGTKYAVIAETPSDVQTVITIVK